MSLAGESALAAETFIWGLQGICQLHRIPFSSHLVLQQFPPPYDLLSLQRTATALGLKCGLRNATVADLSGLSGPFIAILRSAASTNVSSEGNSAFEPDTSSLCNLAIVIKCQGGGITYFVQGRQHPLATSLDEFEAQFAGKVMLSVPSAPELRHEDASSENPQRFGFRWFIPELLRHKAIWRDVLLASLAIQLMALATPVFTQVVIDKVIVHHTISTLVVIGVALAVFILFTAVMSWVRQYLVLHTGNRIDAVLGSQVFEHLFKLPPRYFEHRPTGVLVARVQGVETIREFLSGAAVTLILDVPFLFIFLAIMFYYSLTLTLITVAVLLLVVILSFAITPILRARLNRQFLLGARNQAFLTEYVSGMETVKSLQMEPQLNKRF